MHYKESTMTIHPWMKVIILLTRQNVNVDGNALHAISSIMDGDFDKMTD